MLRSRVPSAQRSGVREGAAEDKEVRTGCYGVVVARTGEEGANTPQEGRGKDSCACFVTHVIPIRSRLPYSICPLVGLLNCSG